MCTPHVSSPAPDPVPAQYAARGATSMNDAMLMAQQDASNAQLAAQVAIANQQKQEQDQQLQYQQQIQAQQQQQAQEQADRQTQYDTGRQQAEQGAIDSINNAFAQFTPDYYKTYQTNYVSHYQPQIDQQYAETQKSLDYSLADAGILRSSAAADKQGLLFQEKGQAQDDVANQAATAANQLQQNVTNAKQNLVSQVTSANVLGSPVAPGTTAGVQTALDTTNKAISGLTQTAQDQAVQYGQLPTYSPLSNIFGSVASGVGNYIAGRQAANIMGAIAAPGGSMTAASPLAGVR